ncbi:5'-nucleotidase C-terminal domain-containing protein [Pontibacter anaerobius]|uniref:5'-nucleotidase C-terminal domain-containing protein n=1 Tax=Pontibacter anaerobius TaxID=2993940 RepID=A0ABT3RBF7_9BACT|nr:5'-nucleotidase C-terminal domain-containing protein [Pontibacter anaerobius]MCX2738718.1 5'-nucleotidase C-terminal domain-containing protein [Pontibacter anaerobius]
MKSNFSKVLAVLALSLSIAGCQRPWVASPSLSETDVPVDQSIAPDPEMEAQIAPYREEVTMKMSEVVGTAPVALSKGDYESPLGNFVVDLQLEQAAPLYKKPIDLSLTTNGGLRVPLPEGKITTGNVFELMPFENELVVLTLKGETVKQLFDYAAGRKNAPIGNATYTVQNGKATAINIGGKPFDPGKTYTLVTSNYLAGGGDDLSMLKNAVKYENVGLLLRDAILQHIRQLTEAGKPVTADTTKRVTILP